MSLNKTFTGVIANTGGGTVTTFSTIATDSFFANITAGTAAPTTVAFTTIDSASLIWDATTHTFQRAAMTGEVTSSQNSNATVVVRSTDFAWTGVHSFTSTTFAVTTSSTVAIAGAGNTSLTTSSGGLTVENLGGGVIDIETASGDITVFAGSGLLLNGTAGSIIQAKATPDTVHGTGQVKINADTNIRLLTSDVERLEIEPDGAWQLGGDTGTANDTMTSQGSAAPPTWQIPVAFTTIFSSTVAGQLDNLAIGDVNVVRLTPTAPREITGMVPPRNGQMVIVLNAATTAGFTLKMTDESDATTGTASTAANRFALNNSTSMTIQQEGMAIFWYDTTSSRWRANQ